MKEDPNDQSRFLTENSTRSDFFIVMVNVDLPYVIAVNWRAGRRGGSLAAPGKRSLVRKLTALAYFSNLFVFTLD
ncbi:hypothetical protein [Priestia megaterium]|uniref:hypothetical protein n=1 Tax=Priestia megaterium TaxID=1404 RepID=UPI001932C068